jgi:hypothetical protein
MVFAGVEQDVARSALAANAITTALTLVAKRFPILE